MRACGLWFALVVAVGCKAVEPRSAAKSPLEPLAVSPETISLEIFSAPAGPSDPQFAQLWKLVDEQPLPAEVRRELAANGLRAGLVGPSVPSELAAVLKVTDRRVEDSQRQLVSMDPDGVVLRVLHTPSGKRTELVIPRVREEISLLEAVDGRAHGKTYRRAECRMALRAFAEHDGRVRLELTPEVHHGEFKSRVRGGDGRFLWTQEREKKVFDKLKIDSLLAPGQMLLVTSRPEPRGSLGGHFFTELDGDRPRPMLWVFRAARAAPDGAFYDGPTPDHERRVANDQEE
jgi:hypothetical protein